MENKKNKLLFTIPLIIGITLIVLGIFLGKDNKKTSNNELPVDNQKLANSILKQLNIDDFLVSYFSNSTEINKNLLDLTSNGNMIHYFLCNGDVDKYVVDLENSDSPDLIYIKYSDFIKEIKEKFNAEPQFDYQNTAVSFSNLITSKEGKNNIDLNSITGCNFTDNTENCYVLIGAGNIEDNKSVEFSSLQMNDNVIIGNVKKYYDSNKKNAYIEGTFEFEFEKLDTRYIVKSFKIIKINE